MKNFYNKSMTTVCLVLVLSLNLVRCSSTQTQLKEPESFAEFEKETLSTSVPEDEAEIKFDESGYASWYGNQFQNKPTASGAPFDKNKLTGAHRTLPFGTEVKLVNLDNKKETIITINDRGPFNKARIIDVSEKVAEILEFKDSGLAKVGIMVLSKEEQKLVRDDDFNLDDEDDEEDEEEPTSKPPKKEEPKNKPKEKLPPPKKPSNPIVKENKETKPQPSVLDIQPKGFTIQVGVFKEKKRVDALKNELKPLVTEPIFVFMRGDSFVMQIGDFQSREDAVVLRDKLKLRGYFSFIPPK